MIPDLRGYIGQETAISAAINTAIGAAFFVAVFHDQAQVALRGRGGIVFDCLPQGFMVGLMSVLPPSLLTRSRLRKGRLLSPPRLANRSHPPSSLALRAVLMALAGMVGLTAIAALLALGVSSVPFAMGLVLKSLAGGVEAAIITPIALRALLGEATCAVLPVKADRRF